MSELLIEIFSEEIPARMQLQAQSDFKALWQSALDKKNASFVDVQSYVAPQRLVVCVTGLESVTKGTNETRRGPKTNAPEAALSGFLKSTGKTKDQLTEKDGYWYAEISESGKKTTEFLPEMLDEVIDAMPWPKTMRWYNHQTKSMSKPWIRPVRSILCMYDGKPVNFNVAGFGVDTGAATYGHRFLAPTALTITNFADYKKQLEKAYVILDHLERQAMIKKLVSEQAVAKGFKLKEDQGLLEEVAGLVDYPFAHLGKIEEKFMHLPDVVLSTSMKVHQKYFTIVGSNGEIAPFFGVVTNVPAKTDDRTMLDGLERVLRARLADATFFYEGDLKSFIMGGSHLKNIIFHAKLGSVADQVSRLQNLMTTEDGKRAVFLCKLDLVTEMVGEFPELQGIMGEIYAIIQGEKPEIAAALREYYLPQGPSDSCPAASISVELALWSKLDALFGFIGIAGIKPTGSKDPFGLRRAAIGIIRLLIENNLFRNIADMVVDVDHQYRLQDLSSSKNAKEETLFFIYDRLKVYLKDQGIEHDCVDAVLSKKSKVDNPWIISECANALQSLLNTDAGKTLKAAHKRSSGVLPKDFSAKKVDPLLLKEPAEQELYQRLVSIEDQYGQLLNEYKYKEAMTLLSSLSGPIDMFFDKVTVNCDENVLKENRYALLNHFTSLIDQIADFSKLQG